MNLSQIYECRNWKTEHYNSVLEIAVLFLGIHKWEPDIYAFALQVWSSVKIDIDYSGIGSKWS
jgi:hypothetical protein